MIRIHSHHDHQARQMSYAVTDDGEAVCEVRVPDQATFADVVAELGKAAPFVEMVAALVEEG